MNSHYGENISTVTDKELNDDNHRFCNIVSIQIGCAIVYHGKEKQSVIRRNNRRTMKL